MAVVFVALLPHCQGGVLMGVWRRVALVVLTALFAACSDAAPTPTLAPTPEPTLTPTVAPTLVATEVLINKPESFEGYTLFEWGSIYLIDHLGRTVHKWMPDPQSNLTKLLDTGNLLLHGNREIDIEGNVVWSYRHFQHHDLLKLPNGNILFLSRLTIPREEAIEIGANSNALSCSFLWGAHIVEARPTGPMDAEIVWEWSVLDHLIQDFDPEKPNYGRVEDHPELVDINYNLDTACIPDEKSRLKSVADWMHSNALDYNADLDQIMLTVRHFSEVWIIDHSTSAEDAVGHAGGNSGKGGDLLYRWGNPRAHRAGTYADQRLFFPHNAHWIPDGLPGAGNVLIFNNGNERTGTRRGYSSVDEIALPADGYNYSLDAGSAYGPRDIIWRYVADPVESFYSAKRGSAQRLPNGNTLVSDDGPSKRRIFEVTQERETVWELAPLMKDIDSMYRSYRYAADHPGIQKILAFYRMIYRAAIAGEPAARGEFDLYLADKELTYVKEPCDPEDATPRVFLHVAPERMDDLQEGRQRYGFNNLNFDFLERGAAFDGKCVARVPLPDYPIASVRTGQFTPEGELWRVEFEVGDGPTSPALR